MNQLIFSQFIIYLKGSIFEARLVFYVTLFLFYFLVYCECFDLLLFQNKTQFIIIIIINNNKINVIIMRGNKHFCC